MMMIIITKSVSYYSCANSTGITLYEKITRKQ